MSSQIPIDRQIQRSYSFGPTMDTILEAISDDDSQFFQPIVQPTVSSSPLNSYYNRIAYTYAIDLKDEKTLNKIYELLKTKNIFPVEGNTTTEALTEFFNHFFDGIGEKQFVSSIKNIEVTGKLSFTFTHSKLVKKT